jgi:uncharacterized SAM-binding protein YcdF (DUF218 family)
LSSVSKAVDALKLHLRNNPLKAFVAPLGEPVGIIWLLMATGVFILLMRRQWRAAAWLVVPVVLLFLLGSTPLTDVLVLCSERNCPDESLTGPADAVVALGEDIHQSSRDVFGFCVGPGGERTLTAATLVRQGKAKTLVLGGSTSSVPGQPGVPTMSLLQSWLVSLGINSSITNLGICANTHEEAIHFKTLQAEKKWRRVILVTSALHMKRAKAAFEKEGIEVKAFPCDFQVYGVPDFFRVSSPFPSQRRLRLLALYLHEEAGWWVYKWKGWI